MRVLVACEESQAVTIELRRLGHEAYSCDIQECSGGHPEWHIQADALELLKLKWDMIIAHPPCTYLSAAGAQRLFNKGGIVKDETRYTRGGGSCGLFHGFSDCGSSEDRSGKSRTDEMLRIAEVYTDHRAVLFRASVAQKDMPVAQGIAASVSDGIGGAARILGTKKRTKGQRIQRRAQKQEDEEQDIPWHRKGYGRAMGREK